MTIAELHGKLSSTGSNLHDHLEDLLTSDVFGGLLYAEVWDTLAKWFAPALNLDDETILAVFPGLATIREASMAFWPRGGARGREPDVALKVVSTEGGRYGICIEAKYLSAKSNVDVRMEDDGADHLAGARGDQLADQWWQISAALPDSYGWKDVPSDRRALVYLTAHPEFPRGVLEESIQYVRRPEDRRRLFWLGWCHLHRVLDEQGYRRSEQRPESGAGLLLAHLFDLLDRKGLRFFSGFSECSSAWPGSKETGETAGYWHIFEFAEDERCLTLGSPVFWRSEE